jgi:glycerate dehydrogenase
MRDLQDLRLIVVAATGVNNIDLEAAQRRGIAVANAPGYAVESVPEHVLMMVLALRRNLLRYREAVKRGAWGESPHFCLSNYPILDVKGARFGIIGYGALGQATGRIAEAFSAQILIAEHKGETEVRLSRTPFEDVLRTADILSLHCPLNDETRGLIGREELAMMKRSAILINCARGGIVDEEALMEALRAERIAGAGVDVLTEEPPRGFNPLLAEDLPNLIVTPHNAWASRRAASALADQITDVIEAFMRGEELNRVA